MKLEDKITIIFNKSYINKIKNVIDDFKNIKINQFYNKYKEILNLDNCGWFESDTEKDIKSDNDVNLLIVWLMKEHNLLVEAKNEDMSVMYAENILKFVNKRIKDIGIENFYIKESISYVLNNRSLIININKELSKRDLRAICFAIADYEFIGIFKSEISYELVNNMKNILDIEDVDSEFVLLYVSSKDIGENFDDCLNIFDILKQTLTENFMISNLLKDKMSEKELTAFYKTFERRCELAAKSVELEVTFFVQYALTHINNYIFDLLTDRKSIDIERNKKFYIEKLLKMLLTYEYPKYMNINCKFSRKFQRISKIKEMTDNGVEADYGLDFFINNLKRVRDYIECKS